MTDENIFPCSVTATAGIFSLTASSSSSSMRHAPSRSEYSVWRWRWTNSGIRKVFQFTFLDSYILTFLDVTESLPSFPFDRRRRLRADVVDDAVDAFDFVDDPRRDAREQFVGQPRPVRRHAIAALHCAHRDPVLVGPCVAHHADA